MRLRLTGPSEIPELLRMFDEAIVRLTERGSPGRWATRPWSEIPERVEPVRRTASTSPWPAEVDDVVAGALSISGVGAPCPTPPPTGRSSAG